MSATTDKHCQARQYSDQMMCSRCGLQWDVTDPDPPQCKKKDEKVKPFRFLRPPFPAKTTNR